MPTELARGRATCPPDGSRGRVTLGTDLDYEDKAPEDGRKPVQDHAADTGVPPNSCPVAQGSRLGEPGPSPRRRRRPCEATLRSLGKTRKQPARTEPRAEPHRPALLKPRDPVPPARSHLRGRLPPSPTALQPFQHARLTKRGDSRETGRVRPRGTARASTRVCSPCPIQAQSWRCGRNPGRHHTAPRRPTVVSDRLSGQARAQRPSL